MIMISIQYFIYFVIIQTISSFVPYELGSNGDIFKYNGDKSSSTTSSSRSVDEIPPIPSANSYYSIINSNSSSLIDFMRSLYEQEKMNRLQPDYNLIRALAPRIVQIDNATMYVFDLNLIRRTESIYSVSLHFYKRRTRWPISYALNEIYSSHRLSSLSAQIQLESDSYGWQSFPIGDLIQRQMNYLSSAQKIEYFGLTFKPSVTAKNQRRNIVDLERFSVYTPFMIIYSNESKQANIFEEFIPNNFEDELKNYEPFEREVNQTHRFRRSAENTSSTTDLNILSNVWNETLTSMEPEKCGLKPLVIDFSDVGFSSWIIEPKSYVSNLCSGICTTKSMTNQALIQYFLQRLGVRNDVDFPEACCVPQRYSSLMIFYKSSDYHYLIRHVPNMIVDDCHCR